MSQGGGVRERGGGRLASCSSRSLSWLAQLWQRAALPSRFRQPKTEFWVPRYHPPGSTFAAKHSKPRTRKPTRSSLAPLVRRFPTSYRCESLCSRAERTQGPTIKSRTAARPLLVLCRPRQQRSRPLHPHHTHRSPRHPRRHFPFHLIHLHRRRPCPLHLRPHAAGHLPYHRRHSGRARPSRLPACSSHLPLYRAR